ncbi:MAG TPA: lactonase family protein [Kofleriaceae bacterium]|jgi:6-phosphogluconolactonase
MRIAALVLLAACGGGSSTPIDSMTPLDSDTADAVVPSHLVAYISGNAPEIAWYDFDLATGSLTSAGQAAAWAANPSFLAMTKTHLYGVAEGGDRVGAYSIEQTTGALSYINDQSSGGDGPAHLSVDRTGTFVLAANYTNGMIAVLPIRSDGGVSTAVDTRMAGVNAHMILTDAANKFVFVPCKGSDYIAQYQFNATTGALTANSPATVMTAAGAGPRHLAFAPNGAFAYVIDENLATLMVFGYDATTGRLTELQTVSNRAPGATAAGNTGAEVVVHPNGKFVYASNRGDDNVSAFSIGSDGKVTLVGHVSVGMTPRAFTLDPTGAWMLVANQGSDTVTTYKIDQTTGLPAPMGDPIAFTNPSFVGFVSL